MYQWRTDAYSRMVSRELRIKLHEIRGISFDWPHLQRCEISLCSHQKVCIQNDVRAILQRSKKLYILACKRDPMVRDRDETEIFDFQSETRSRPRPSHVSSRLRWDRDVWKLRLETVSRRRDRDYIPASAHYSDKWVILFEWISSDLCCAEWNAKYLN